MATAKSGKNVILEVSDLSKSYANEGVQNHVLNHIDLDIYKGDFTVIMGPSGSGKSTLMYCISGMEKVTAGHVIFEQEDITSFSEKHLSRLRLNKFGFVFQQIHLVNNLTLFENAAVPGYLKGDLSNEAVRARVTELMEMFSIGDAARRLPSQASGGEKQRAAIARALINDPEILFADEPTGALNRANTDAILDHFTQINEDGQSIIMVTHDVHAALRASRILYILDGRIHGELDLPFYKEDDMRRREAQVSSWLQSLTW